MNVPVPFAQNPFGFLYIMAIALALTLGAIWVMMRKKWI